MAVLRVRRKRTARRASCMALQHRIPPTASRTPIRSRTLLRASSKRCLPAMNLCLSNNWRIDAYTKDWRFAARRNPIVSQRLAVSAWHAAREDGDQHCGSRVQARPSVGSWVSYGLGTENKDLPSYMVLAPEVPYAGSAAWESNFLPAFHQGVRVIPGQEAIPNMTRDGYADIQNMDLGLIEFFNKRHLAQHDADRTLATRIKTFETAFGMQRQAPEAFDISQESDATLKLYGLEGLDA